jgi:general secretion pathway protein L
LPRNLWGWTCGLLAVGCILTPFLRQQIALDNADRVIAAHQAAADLGEALRRRLAIANLSRAAIAAARQRGDALEVLSALTTALPDGTWLNDLSMAGGDLSIDGQSDNAPQLIALLAAVPELHGPSFTAPVTRSADQTTDQFSLHATVGQ